MADDKKTPQEASNIFHSIMKASVDPVRLNALSVGRMLNKSIKVMNFQSNEPNAEVKKKIKNKK